MKNKHLGSDFDDFLMEEGLLEDCESVAIKRVLAIQIAQAMKEKGLSKSALARRMRTSRPALERLLDAKNPSVTLNTLQKAAAAVGKKLHIEIVDT